MTHSLWCYLLSYVEDGAGLAELQELCQLQETA